MKELLALFLTLSTLIVSVNASRGPTAHEPPQDLRAETAGTNEAEIAGRNAGQSEAPSKYWLGESLENTDLETAIWEFGEDKFDISDIEEPLRILSVSPSGKHILAANQITQNMSARDIEGIPNPLGRLPERLYLFAHQDGIYKLINSLEVDAESDPALSGTLGVCRLDGVAWNANETQALIAAGIYNVKSRFMSSPTNLYLADFERNTFDKLAGDGEMGNHHLLPQWIDSETICFVRYQTDSDHMLIVSLVGMHLETGEEELLADLSSEGRAMFVDDYAIAGEYVYYSKEGYLLADSGFYETQLRKTDAPQLCLLSIQEIRENNIHPYLQAFSSVQISSDGRWACITADDRRFNSRDFPLVDHPTSPQSDPSSAVSIITKREWIPCHNIFLYDLEKDEQVDVFTDPALLPYVSVVTAATFAPDGKSLLCAVFGDDDEWKLESFERTSLYQIRLEDDSFDTVRIFKTETLMTPNRLSWQKNNSVMIWTWEDILPNYLVQIVIPAAFEGLMDEVNDAI